MVEPLLRDGLQGTIRAELLDGSLDITVPITGRDHRRLESSHWALNALLRTFAQAVATDLPEGVPSDAIAIRLVSPAVKTRSSAKTGVIPLEPAGQYLRLPPEVFHLPIGSILCHLIEQRSKPSERASFKFTVINEPGSPGILSNNQPQILIGSGYLTGARPKNTPVYVYTEWMPKNGGNSEDIRARLVLLGDPEYGIVSFRLQFDSSVKDRLKQQELKCFYQ